MRKPKAELSRKPQNVSEWVWYYEEKRGMCVIVQPGGEAGIMPAFTIPWSKVCRSVDRYRAAKR